jgi:hypothetical protein
MKLEYTIWLAAPYDPFEPGALATPTGFLDITGWLTIVRDTVALLPRERRAAGRTTTEQTLLLELIARAGGSPVLGSSLAPSRALASGRSLVLICSPVHDGETSIDESHPRSGLTAHRALSSP